MQKSRYFCLVCVFRHFLTQVLFSISFLCVSQVSASQANNNLKSSEILASGLKMKGSGLPNKMAACVRISNDSMMEIWVHADKSNHQSKMAIKDHPMFGLQYNLDSLKKAQPGILFLDFDKFDNSKDLNSSVFSWLNMKSWYWFIGLIALFVILLFNRYLMNFARQSTNY